MKKDPEVFLKHILEAIEVIEKVTEDTSKEEFMESVKIRDTVIRRLTIIGEAANNLPDEFREKYSEPAWEKIISLRNLLTHEYFGVDLDLTYKIINKDIPNLKQKILTILDKMKS